MLHENNCRIIPLKRQDTCAHFIEDHTKGVDITTLIPGTSSGLLWRGIMGCSQLPANEGDSGCSEQFGNAEIGKNRLS